MSTVVTSSLPVKIQPGDKDWKIFEKEIANATVHMETGTDSVTHDAKQMGVYSKVNRQIDVLVTGRLNGEYVAMAIECKRHGRAVDVTEIDKFIGMLLDLRVDSGMFYAFDAVTPAARNRAANALHPKITLKEMAGRHFEPEWSADASEFLPWGSCEAPNCRGGEVAWQSWPQEDGGKDVQAGVCDFCASWTVRCVECEQEEYVVSDELVCSSCCARYELRSGYQDYDVQDVQRVDKGHE